MKFDRVNLFREYLSSQNLSKYLGAVFSKIGPLLPNDFEKFSLT